MQPIERPTERPANEEEQIPRLPTSREISAFKGLLIEWKDGLPADRTEEVVNETTLFASGLTSTLAALTRLNGGDQKAAEEELKAIEEERKQKQEEQLEQMTAAAPGQGPGGDDVAASAQIVAKMKAERGKAGTADEKTSN